ncbi:MAG: SwmB domain-containing protein [Fluviibacter sp.]
MPAIKLETFGGMNPAVDDHLLPNSGASYSENAWVYEGNLSGFRAPRLVKNLTNSAAKRVYRIPLDPYEKTNIANSVWMEFTDANTDFVRAPVIDDQYSRYYWFGPSTTPSYNTLTRIQTGAAAYTLGVPAPTAAPGVSAPTLAPDTVAPVAASATINGAIIVITFTEQRRLDPEAVPPTNAFNVTANDAAYQVASVSVDELNCKATLMLVKPVPPSSSIKIVYTPPAPDMAIKDNSGNLCVGFTLTIAAADNLTLDLLAPEFGWADADANGKYIWVTFKDDNLLDLTKNPPTTAWMVFINGVARNVTESLKLDGTRPYKMAYRLTIEGTILPDDKVTLSYVRPGDSYAVADIYGNKTSTFSNATVKNNVVASKTSDPPKLASISLIGRTVTISFEKELDIALIPSTQRFTLSPAVAIGAVSIDGPGKTVFLNLQADTYYNSGYSLSYNATEYGTGSISNVFITDKGGNRAVAFTGLPVTNNNPTPAPVYSDG